MNVTKKDLYCLFANCHILEYCPARTIQLEVTPTTMSDKSKLLPGYELLTS